MVSIVHDPREERVESWYHGLNTKKGYAQFARGIPPCGCVDVGSIT